MVKYYYAEYTIPGVSGITCGSVVAPNIKNLIALMKSQGWTILKIEKISSEEFYSIQRIDYGTEKEARAFIKKNRCYRSRFW
jgi:hypothetical protein